jgi:hypothetical protein
MVGANGCFESLAEKAGATCSMSSAATLKASPGAPFSSSAGLHSTRLSACAFPNLPDDPRQGRQRRARHHDESPTQSFEGWLRGPAISGGCSCEARRRWRSPGTLAEIFDSDRTTGGASCPATSTTRLDDRSADKKNDYPQSLCAWQREWL